MMRTSIRNAVIMLAIAVVAFVAFLLVRPHGNGPLRVGDSVPDFSLPNFTPAAAGGAIQVGGDPNPPTIRLSYYRHHIVLVNFWASWCPPCVEEAPSLENFAKQMRPLGVAVIGV